MAKRFTDTNKWRKDFIRGLQGAYKLLWLYILDECDHAGIWHVELDVASLRIGNELKSGETIKAFGNHIVVFDGGNKWFIPDFIEFQYGELNPENRAHKSVLDLLTKYKLKGHIRGLQGRKDKDKELVKDIDKDKIEFSEFWNLYNHKVGDKRGAEKKWDRLPIEIKQKIILILPEYLKTIKDKQFQPHPTTWLNQERWNNEIINSKVEDDLEYRRLKEKVYGKPV